MRYLADFHDFWQFVACVHVLGGDYGVSITRLIFVHLLNGIGALFLGLGRVDDLPVSLALGEGSHFWWWWLESGWLIEVVDTLLMLMFLEFRSLFQSICAFFDLLVQDLVLII